MINIKPFTSPYEYIQITKPQGYSLSLKVGEVVKAEVIDILPTGGIVIRMKGSYITVRTEIPLQKESSLLLKILELPQDNRLKIQLISILNNKNLNINKSELSKLSIVSLGKLVSLENLTEFEKIMLFQLLKEKINPVDLNNIPLTFIKNISPENLKYAVYNSGIFLEAKLKNILKGKKEDIKNDMKAFLLKSDKNQYLENIYIYQLLSKLTKSIYTYIPIVLDGLDGFEFSYKKNKKGHHTVKLNLNFKIHGKVLIFVSYYKSFLNVFFKFEDNKLKSICEENIEQLKEKLSNIKASFYFFGDETSFDKLDTFEISNHLMDFKI